MITTRRAILEDAISLSKFIYNLGIESQYLLYDVGERNCDESLTKSYLIKMNKDDKSAVYIALDADNNIIGFICGEVSHLNRISHVMKANIGVLKNCHGLGVGKILAEKLLTHALSVGILRIEATVIKSNKISFNLCKKFGFEVEGIRRGSIKIGDDLHDEYLMSKLVIAK